MYIIYMYIHIYDQKYTYSEKIFILQFIQNYAEVSNHSSWIETKKWRSDGSHKAEVKGF